MCLGAKCSLTWSPPARPRGGSPPPALQPHSPALGLFLPPSDSCQPERRRPCALAGPRARSRLPGVSFKFTTIHARPPWMALWWRLGCRTFKACCAPASALSVRPPHLSLRQANYRDVPPPRLRSQNQLYLPRQLLDRAALALAGLSLCTEPLTDHEKSWFRNKQPSLVTSARNTSICLAALLLKPGSMSREKTRAAG